jgi:hypothetical protein
VFDGGVLETPFSGARKNNKVQYTQQAQKQKQRKRSKKRKRQSIEAV